MKLKYHTTTGTLEATAQNFLRVIGKKGQAEKKCIDYYPFGMTLPSRNYNQNDYKYAFNGMEKDDEVKGGGNSYTTQFRQYDSRVGKWLATDPVTHAEYSPYSTFDNNPIFYIDPVGANADGYKDEEGNLIWAHDQKGSTFEQNGKTYTKVSDDYFEFSDKARKEGKRISYSGKIDVGTAEYDDIIAGYADVTSYRTSEQFGPQSAEELFDFSNISTSNGWSTSGTGFADGGTKIFRTTNGDASVYFGTSRPRTLKLTNVPFIYSPVTNEKVLKINGEYSFTLHPAEPRPYGIMLLGSRSQVHGSNSDNISSYIKFKSPKDLSHSWKYLIREVKKKK